MKKFKSVKEFINTLIDNEGVVFGDAYGRKWRYKYYEFMYKDIGDVSWQDGIFCLHLYNTGIAKEI